MIDKKILVTGGSGNIARSIIPALAIKFREVVVVSRYSLADDYLHIANISTVAIGEYTSLTNWLPYLHGIDIVVHCAGISVLAGKKEYHIAMEIFREFNVRATVNLAEQAVKSGVKRFVFLSSVKACGEESGLHRKFSHASDCSPVSPYGISKKEAEDSLMEIKSHGLEVIIIRLPMVYGFGINSGLYRLAKLVYHGVPLPFLGVRNIRSFICIENVSDFVVLCSTHSSAGNQIFFISDGEDLSTPDLMKKIGDNLGKSPRLFYFPVPLLRNISGLFGRTEEIEKLTRSLAVDISLSHRLLGWKPPVEMDSGISNMLV